MKVYKNRKSKHIIKAKIKSAKSQQNIGVWLFMVFTLIFIFVALLSASNSSVIASYPLQQPIAIDAGHGGIDVGASGFGYTESQLNLQVAIKVQECLESVGKDVVMTRTGDYGLYKTTLPGFKKRDMQARKEICESANAGLVISIHMNASEIANRTGVVIYCDFQDEESLLLAKSIASQFEGAQVKDGDFYITSKIDMPAVIVECGFITTESEAEKLASEEYQTELATNISRGILIYQRNVSL